MVDCACTNFPAGLGNVTIGAALGIGTTTPTYKLDVQGGVTRLKGTATDALHVDAAGADYPTSAIVKFRDHVGSDRWWFGAGLGGAADQGFGLYGWTSPTGYRLYALANGNVGIGTGLPQHRLDVQGGTTRLKGFTYDPLYLDAPGPSTPTTVLVRFRTSDQTEKWMLGMGLGGPPDEGFGLYGLAAPSPGYRLYALPNGNVGIGTASPQATLHVAGTLRTDQNVGIGTAPATARLEVRSPNDAASTTIVEARSLNGAVGVGIGYDSIGIVGGVTNWGLNVNARGSGPVTLQSAPGVTGNVGIGTTLPVARLTVQVGAGQPVLQLEAAHGVDGTGARLRFAQGGDVPLAQIASVSEGTSTGRVGLGFSTYNQGAFGERLRITAGGAVGIGRPNPVSTLHVQGTVTAEGSITASNGPISTTGGYDIVSSGKYYAGSTLIAGGSGCYYM